MSPSDFLTWLDGFRAALGNRAPTAEEWALVAEKAAAVRKGVVTPAGPAIPAYPVSPGYQPLPLGFPPIVTCSSESQPAHQMVGLMTWN